MTGYVRVLVVDDSLLTRNVLTDALNADPQIMVVGQASDGEGAVSAARRLRPDIITMDVSMPGVDGYEAVRRLRAEGCTTPILAVTAYAMSGDREECLAMGCDDFISKPLEWDRFLAKLTRLLAAKSGVSG